MRVVSGSGEAPNRMGDSVVIQARDRRNRLFECIGMNQSVGSHEGYIAETSSERSRIIPSGEQQHEYRSLYRIRRTQEKRELLYQAGRRGHCGRGESGGAARRPTAVGETVATAVGRGD